MKKTLLVLLMFTFAKSYTQIDSFNLYEKSRKDWTPYGYDKDMLSINLINNSYTTQITYFDLNFVLQRIQSFVSKLGLISNGSSDIDTKNKVITFSYYPSYYVHDSKTKKLNLKFNYFINSQHNMIINNCIIYGDYNLLVNFYVSFWSTTINIEPSKSKIAYNYFWQDKIILSRISSNGTGTITISNNTIKDESDYESKLKVAILNPSSVKLNKNFINEKKSPETIISQKVDTVSFIEEKYYCQTENLLILESPNYDSHIEGYLHKGAVVRTVDSQFKKVKSKNYIYVKIIYDENNCGLNGIGIMGWIMKKYLSKNKISNDTFFQKIETVTLIQYAGDIAHDPNKNMWRHYPYPKYKGGKEN